MQKCASTAEISTKVSEVTFSILSYSLCSCHVITDKCSECHVVCSNVDNEDDVFCHTIDSFGAICFDGFGQEATTNAPVSQLHATQTA